MKTIQMFCPNCGQKVAGCVEGKVFRKTCPRCKAAIFSVVNEGKKREIKIKVTKQG